MCNYFSSSKSFSPSWCPSSDSHPPLFSLHLFLFPVIPPLQSVSFASRFPSDCSQLPCSDTKQEKEKNYTGWTRLSMVGCHVVAGCHPASSVTGEQGKNRHWFSFILPQVYRLLASFQHIMASRGNTRLMTYNESLQITYKVTTVNEQKELISSLSYIWITVFTRPRDKSFCLVSRPHLTYYCNIEEKNWKSNFSNVSKTEFRIRKNA